MFEKVSVYLNKGPIYRDLIQRVLEHPYEEKNKAFAALSYGEDALEKALAELEGDLILLSLSAQSAAGLESRVMKSVLLINPELENDLGKLVGAP